MRYDEEIKFLSKIKFNFAAFILTPIWCFFHGQLIPTIVLIALWALPFLLPLGSIINIILKLFILMISGYYGVKGKDIALDSGVYRDEIEYNLANQRWTFAAVTFLVLGFIFSQLLYTINAGTSIFKIGLDAISK